jgi:hypothetical protein
MKGTVHMELEQEPMAVEEQQSTTPEPVEEHGHGDEYGEPTGAFTFVMLMLTFYALYWAYTWVEIFVLRGN